MGGQATQEDTAFIETSLDRCQFCRKKPDTYFIVTATIEYFDKISPVMALCSEHAAKFFFGSSGITKQEAIIYQVMHS